MKYLFYSLILFLTSCSLNKDSTYWNEDPIKKSGDYKSMTFDEFNLFLKDYSNNAEYPNIIDETFKDNSSKALKVKTEGSKNRINKMLSGKTKQYPKGIKN